jgi:hypothetical protein
MVEQYLSSGNKIYHKTQFAIYRQMVHHKVPKPVTATKPFEKMTPHERVDVHIMFIIANSGTAIYGVP